ncbi:MAG: CoA pyrophosphatase [Dehalococcoidia bacterium]|nr:CoA pyrophosphatase [Dehalococcoidia bacterium]
MPSPAQLDDIRARVAAYRPASIDEPALARAAVLLPLYQHAGELAVLFTVRSELVEHHKGQISFPGGGYDAADGDLRVTALRETWEEIGVAREHVELFGQLDEMVTISDFLVRPFVGLITQPGPYPFVHSEVEVAQILEVPLRHLQHAANVVAEERTYQGRTMMTYSYRFGDHLIWGATARIIHGFLDLVQR